jgi:hypothetical protein
LKRIHLFEFEDQSWFPVSVRNYMTDYLQIIANTLNFYDTVVPIIQKGVEKSGANKIVDLASGGGGGWLAISDKIAKTIPGVTIQLTDFYPNIQAFKNTQEKFPQLFDYSEDSIDATNVPKELKGLRTQFLSFHHFKPEDAKKILQNAVDSNQPIAIFEAIERNAEGFLKAFSTPLTVYALTPFIKPFDVKRLLLTYVLPVVPFFIGFDGMVSVGRMYSQEEMKALTNSLENSESFEWEIGVKRNGLMGIQYLLGYPKN